MIKLSKKLIILSSLCLVILCIPAIKWAISDIQLYPVRYAIKNWQSGNRIPTHEELDKAQKSVSTAINWNDENPEYHDYQGTLFHYQALITTDPILKNSAFSAAANSYRRAIQLRPKWPYSRANLALVKAFLGEIDSEFETSIRLASDLGPWENGVNITLTEAGLLGWVKLNKKNKNVIIDNIQRGIRRNMAPISTIIKQYNKLSLVCANLQRDTYKEKLCGF